MINVTRTELPDKKEFQKYLDEIWKTHWVTNNGKFVKLLEKKLEEYLGVENLILVSNGTLGLQLVFKALGLKGEVITTPFTFVATINALIWEGLTPVFADVDKETFNINPAEVEKKITPKTTAILAVHVYGNSCEVEELEKIAKKYKIELIFDAAHAFNVEYKDKSVLNYGDASVLSFHATKTFHTIEGGAIVVKDKKLFGKLKLYRNFGIKSEKEVLLAGINAKMNEFQAAMGLSNLPNIKNSTLKRKNIYEIYKKKISAFKKIKFQKLITSKYNYSYMPVVFNSQKIRDRVYVELIANGIKPRKYFYPLVSDFKYVKKNSKISVLKNAKKISNSILCFPIYSELDLKDVDKIIKVINLNT